MPVDAQRIVRTEKSDSSIFVNVLLDVDITRHGPHYMFYILI